VHAIILVCIFKSPIYEINRSLTNTSFVNEINKTLIFKIDKSLIIKSLIEYCPAAVDGVLCSWRSLAVQCMRAWVVLLCGLEHALCGAFSVSRRVCERLRLCVLPWLLRREQCVFAVSSGILLSGQRRTRSVSSEQFCV
jgi:hypothetical protein